MAGSWQHATTKGGKLLNNENFCGMIENLGDAYEMAEEMYGMIWLLASIAVQTEPDITHPTRGQITEMISYAAENYKEGLVVGGRQREQ
jgi:hypothetical protein